MPKRTYSKTLALKTLIVVGLIVGGVGLAREFGSFAATSTASFEVEKASLSGGAKAVTDANASSASAVQFTQTTTATKPLLGIYESGGDDQSIFNHFGFYPEISSTYYQSYQLGSILTQQTARIKRGTAANITITTRVPDDATRAADYKSKYPNGIIPGIANGESNSLTWLDQYIAALDAVSKVNANLPTYGSLESEWEVKVNQKTFTGDAANAAVYGKALSVFYQRCQSNAPSVKCTYWIGGSDTAKINAVLAATTQPPHVIAADPYVRGSENQTALQNWNGHLNKFRSSGAVLNSQFTRLNNLALTKGWNIKFAISEHGFQTANYVAADGTMLLATTHTDAQTAAYYTNLRPQMVDADILFSIFFNSDRDVPYVITPNGKHPVPQAVVNFKNSMSAP